MPSKLSHVTLLLGVMVGCTSYQPSPLDDTRLTERLAAPEGSALVQAGARLQHPRLPPLTLDLTKPLTEDALAVIAVLVNPDLKALRAKEGVSQAQVFAAGLLPDPEFSASLDFRAGGAPGVANSYSIGPSWDIASLATRHADVQLAQAEAEHVHYDVAWQEWLVANQARLLARRAASLERQEALARQAAELATRLLEITRRTVVAGDAKIDELGLRQAAFLDARDRALTLVREQEKARQSLNQILGLPPVERVNLAPVTLPPLPEEDTRELFAKARQQRLDLLALQAGYAGQEARLYRAILGQYPRFTLGLKKEYDVEGVHLRGASVTLDLPLFNRNRGAIAVAETTRQQLYEEYVARLHQTRADIAAVVADLHRLADERTLLSRELPELTHVEEVLRAAVSRGDTTVLSYETVRASLLDKQLKLLSLEQAAAEQQVALQLAVGAPVAP